MGLRPTQVHEDAVGEHCEINDLRRVFNGAEGERPFSACRPLLARPACSLYYENSIMSREPEQVRFPARIVAGVAAAILFCLWGAFQSYGFESAYQHQSPDPYQISAQFARLEPVLSAVPEDAVLGYLTDAEAGSVTDSALLASAEYVLAPRLVTRSTNHDWVLGNFTRPTDFAAFGQSLGLRLQHDFGNGIVLYRKEHQP